MKKKRKNFSSQFKAKAGLEAIRGVKTTAEIARVFVVHPTQVTQWKKALQEQASGVFDTVRSPKPADPAASSECLYSEIGRRPSSNEYLPRCHTPKALDRVFGRQGWKNMISALGAKALPRNTISASHLVDDYTETCMCPGEKPSFEEFRRAQHHTMKVLDRAFGRPGWSNLTVAAQRKMRRTSSCRILNLAACRFTRSP